MGTYRHTKPAVLLWRVCPGRLGSRCDHNIEMQTCFVRLCVERSECISSNLTCFHRDHQYSKVTVLREISVKQEKLQQVLLTNSQKSIDRRYSNNTPLGGTRLRSVRDRVLAGTLCRVLGQEKYSWLPHVTETGEKCSPDGPLGSYRDLTNIQSTKNTINKRNIREILLTFNSIRQLRTE